MFSKKLQYGLQFLMMLDGSEGLLFRGVSEMAEQDGLPRKFLESIAAALKKAGVVEVKRGAGGGYRLSRSLNEISLGDVWQALESSSYSALAPSSIRSKGVNEFLNLVNGRYIQLIEHQSLGELKSLVDKENEKNMYYI